MVAFCHLETSKTRACAEKLAARDAYGMVQATDSLDVDRRPEDVVHDGPRNRRCDSR